MWKVSLIFSVILGTGAWAGPNQTKSFDWQSSPSKETAREVIRTRKFASKRDLLAYLADFPSEFAEDLFRLGPEHKLLDAGGGAFYFAEEVVSLRKLATGAPELSPKVKPRLTTFLDTPLTRRPFVTAISLNLERKNIPTYEGRLRLIWGRFFSEIPETELGKFDLITDLKGIFAYSPDADEVLRRYLSLLNDSGVLYLYLGEDERQGFSYTSTVRTKDGRKIPLADWVQSLPGLKTTLLSGSGAAVPNQNRTLRIQVEDRSHISIPVLSLLGIDSQHDGPPTRVYYER
jgi:hypothetical protein